MISHIDHIVLTVNNIENTIEFYTTILKMDVISFGNNRRALAFGNQKINLHSIDHQITPKAICPTPGSQDICFITETQIQAVIDHITMPYCNIRKLI